MTKTYGKCLWHTYTEHCYLPSAQETLSIIANNGDQCMTIPLANIKNIEVDELSIRNFVTPIIMVGVGS